MVFTFAYGSNMAGRGLAAKGVQTVASQPARLRDYELAFDVPCVFPKIEGGVANVVAGARTGGRGEVHGVLHQIDEEGLAKLDAIEAIGILYERKALRVEAYDGTVVDAETYVGLPTIREAGLLPSARYMRILVEGAMEQSLDPTWIQGLKDTPRHAPPRFGRFEVPDDAKRVFDAAELARNPTFVALNGVVFDLSQPSPVHRVLTMLRGGRDLTPVAVAIGAGIDASVAEEERQVNALHQLQHELAQKYPVVGRYAV